MPGPLDPGIYILQFLVDVFSGETVSMVVYRPAVIIWLQQIEIYSLLLS